MSFHLENFEVLTLPFRDNLYSFLSGYKQKDLARDYQRSQFTGFSHKCRLYTSYTVSAKRFFSFWP